MKDFDRTDSFLAATFAALLAVPLMASLRAFDDNTLTSWNWVFTFIDPVRVYFLVVAGIGISFFLSRFDLVERSPAATLPLFAFLAVLPLWGIPESVLDASRYFLQAKHLELYGISSFVREWGSSIGAWTDLPLVPFLFGLIFRVLGESRVFVQAFTTVLFSLTVLLTFLLGRRLYDKETGISAGVLLLGIPYLLVQVPLMLVDVPTMFFMTLALYTFIEALWSGRPARTFSASLALFSALLSKYSAFVMLLALPITVLVLHRKGYTAVVRRSVQVLVPAAALAVTVLLAKHDVVSAQVSLLASYQMPGLGRWQESLFSSFFFQVHPVITIAACFGLFKAIKKRDILFAIPAWFAVFVLFIQHERLRYLIPLLPFFTLMAARGLMEIKYNELRRYLVFSIVTTSLVIAAGAYVPFLKQASMSNLQEAGRFLDSLDTVGSIEVLTLPQQTSSGNTAMAVPLLDLATSKQLISFPNDSFRPGAPVIATSPLRFSWETQLPAFYEEVERPGRCLPIAVISSTPLDQKSRGMIIRTSHLTEIARFHGSTGIFRYKTMVTVFKRDCLDETGQ